MQKKGLTQKRRFFKGIRKPRKKYNQINAPHNTSQYLIENNSSPFYEDDDDINVDFIPSSLIILDDSEDLLDDDLIYQRKMSSASTQGESVRLGNGFELVLDAPVQVDADGMCSTLPCGGNVAGYELLVNQVNNHIALDGNAVSAISIVKKGDFHAFHIDDERNGAVSFLLVTISADVRNT